MQKYNKKISFLLRLIGTVIIFWLIFDKLITFNDQVILKSNDEVIVGKIVKHTAIEVQIQQGNTLRTLSKEQIVRVQLGFFTVIKSLNVSMFLAFSCFFILNIVLVSLRIKLLLQAQEIILTFFESFKMNFIGQLANNFMPGTTGGDLVRIYCVYKKSQQMTKSIIVVFVDRVVGLIGLIILAASILCFQLGKVELYETAIVIFSFLIAIVAGIIIAFFIPDRWVEGKQGVIARAIRAFLLYKHHKKTVIKALFLSLLIHISTNLAVYGFAMSLGITNVSLAVFFVYVPVGFLVMMLPISLAGWGTGEAAYTYLFGKVGVPAAKAVVLAILLKLGQIISSLWGLVWIFDKDLHESMDYSKNQEKNDDY